MVQNLCKQYSSPLLSLAEPDSTETKTYHPFPPPSVLAEDSVSTTLRTLGFGYRAEFVQRTAKMLFQTHGSSALPNDPTEASERWLKGLRSKSTADARQELLQFIGVGRKVADCVLLMSLDKVFSPNLNFANLTHPREQPEGGDTSRHPCPSDCSKILRSQSFIQSEDKHDSKTV